MQPTSNRSARRLRGAPARRAAPNIWMQPREGKKKNISEGAFVPEKCSRTVTELLCLILNNSGGTEWSRGPTWTELTSQNGLITLVCKMEQTDRFVLYFSTSRLDFPTPLYTPRLPISWPPNVCKMRRAWQPSHLHPETAQMVLATSFIVSHSLCLRSFPSTWKQKYLWSERLY